MASQFALPSPSSFSTQSKYVAELEARNAAGLDGEELTAEEQEDLGSIRKKRKEMAADHRQRKNAGDNHSRLPAKFDGERKKTTGNMKVTLRCVGMWIVDCACACSVPM